MSNPANHRQWPPGRYGTSMARISAVFISLCMLLIAGAVGTVLYLRFGLSGAESAIVALTALTGLALYNIVSARTRDRSRVRDQITDLSRGTAELGRQVAEFGRRLATLESKFDNVDHKARTATDSLALEIDELGSLVKQLAESVAAHDSALAGDHFAPAANLRGNPVERSEEH